MFQNQISFHPTTPPPLIMSLGYRLVQDTIEFEYPNSSDQVRCQAVFNRAGFMMSPHVSLAYGSRPQNKLKFHVRVGDWLYAVLYQYGPDPDVDVNVHTSLCLKESRETQYRMLLDALEKLQVRRDLIMRRLKDAELKVTHVDGKIREGVDWDHLARYSHEITALSIDMPGYSMRLPAWELEDTQLIRTLTLRVLDADSWPKLVCGDFRVIYDEDDDVQEKWFRHLLQFLVKNVALPDTYPQVAHFHVRCSDPTVFFSDDEDDQGSFHGKA